MKIKRYDKKKALKMPLGSLMRAISSIQKSGKADALIERSIKEGLFVSVHPDLVNAVKEHLAQNAHAEDPHAEKMVAGDCDRPVPDCFGDHIPTG